MKYLFIDWMKDFRCVGGECPMNCCSEAWNIGISDKEIEGYKRLAQVHPFGAEILKAVDEEHNCIQQCDGRCPLLTEEGWCKIVLECGEEHLSATCATFPRQVHQFGDILECMVEICCPLVAERVYRQKRIGFDVEEIEEDDDIIDEVSDMAVYDTLALGRTFLIALFQKYDAGYSAVKLYILLQTIQAIQEMHEKGQFNREAMERWLVRWDDRSCASVRESLQPVAQRVELKAVKLLELLNKLVSIGAMSYIVNDKKNHTLEEELAHWAGDMEGFIRELQDYEKYFSEHYSMAFENYFVFVLFREWMPAKTKMEEFGKSFMIRLLVWCLVQLYAMSIWRKKGEVTPQEYSVIMAGFDRTTAHSIPIFEELVRVLQEENSIAMLLLYLI